MKKVPGLQSLTVQSRPGRDVRLVTAGGIGLSFPGMFLMRVIMQILPH
ncbi:MAG TPA: hypothetical protein VE733_26850 [Streptosporangiaceae bacterium]|jgi:hypothetical protein|nr:hypothetical protein [Streptosporangiaceae bacterium]